MSEYYDRQGQPLTMDQWAKLHSDRSYTVLQQNELPPGWRTPPIYISTIWLGLDHSFGFGGPPLIFETGVFVSEGGGTGIGEELEMYRYSTEEEALAGHQRALEQFWAPRAIVLDRIITNAIKKLIPSRERQE